MMHNCRVGFKLSCSVWTVKTANRSLEFWELNTDLLSHDCCKTSTNQKEPCTSSATIPEQKGGLGPLSCLIWFSHGHSSSLLKGQSLADLGRRWGISGPLRVSPTQESMIREDNQAPDQVSRTVNVYIPAWGRKSVSWGAVSTCQVGLKTYLKGSSSGHVWDDGTS